MKSHYLVYVLVVILMACRDDKQENDDQLQQCGPYPEQESSVFILPYAEGSSFIIGQGNCSLPNRSHALGTVEQYAYDFLMPIGTELVASRSGTVTRVVESFAENNGTPGQENRIEILTNDGSTDVYIHLTTDGADVTVGQRVLQGRVIGRSGNTGNSTEPHLHFCTWRNSTSVPVVFNNTRTHPDGLVEGQRYEALDF